MTSHRSKHSGSIKNAYPIQYDEQKIINPPSSPGHQQRSSLRSTKYVNTLKYDDDEFVEDDQSIKSIKSMIRTSSTPSTIKSISESSTESMSSTTSTTTSTTIRPPIIVNVTSHVDYESEQYTEPGSLNHQQQNIMNTGINTRKISHSTISVNTDHSDTNHPLRYFSRNITVVNNNNDSKSLKKINNYQNKSITKFEQQQQHQPVYESEEYSTSTPEVPSLHHHSTICDPTKSGQQQQINQMYFELSSHDLRHIQYGVHHILTCQLHIRKVRPNICQLDVHFLKYWMNNDTSCGQQYFSVDGERICGHVPGNTIKKFWFIRPDMYLFVKLIKEHQNEFHIKARQVECAHNLLIAGEDNLKNPTQPHLQSQPIQQLFSNSVTEQIQQMDQTKTPEDGMFMIGANQHDHMNNYYYEQKLLDDQTKQNRRLITSSSSPNNLHIPSFNNNWNNLSEEKTRNQMFDQYCDLIATEPLYKIVSPKMDLVSILESGTRNGGRKIIGAELRCRYTIRKYSPRVCAIDVRFKMFRLFQPEQNRNDQTIKIYNNGQQQCFGEYLEIDSGKICGAFPVGHERKHYLLRYLYHSHHHHHCHF